MSDRKRLMGTNSGNSSLRLQNIDHQEQLDMQTQMIDRLRLKNEKLEVLYKFCYFIC